MNLTNGDKIYIDNTEILIVSIKRVTNFIGYNYVDNNNHNGRFWLYDTTKYRQPSNRNHIVEENTERHCLTKLCEFDYPNEPVLLYYEWFNRLLTLDASTIFTLQISFKLQTQLTPEIITYRIKDL